MSFQGQKDVGARRHDIGFEIGKLNGHINAYLRLEKDTRRFIFVFVVNFIIFYSTPVWIIVTKPICKIGSGGGVAREGAGLWPLVFIGFCFCFYYCFCFCAFGFFSSFFFVLLLFVVFLPGIHIDVFKFKSTRATIKDQRIKKNNNAVIMEDCFA